VAFLGFNDRLYRVDDLAAAENLGGIKKIFSYVGQLFKHGKGDEYSQNSKLNGCLTRMAKNV